jgi:YrbI family 3-deoxy-D-manno-octulosonate 8-phosphate phosphatase
MGIELIKKTINHNILVVSKEKNLVVLKRCEKLGIECLYGIDDKVKAITSWLSEVKLTWENVLYVGNDINDIGPLSLAGVSAAPMDAKEEILDMVDWTIPKVGGDGVIRTITDSLLESIPRK